MFPGWPSGLPPSAPAAGHTLVLDPTNTLLGLRGWVPSSRCVPSPRRAGPQFPDCPGIGTALGVAAVRQTPEMTWARGRSQGASAPPTGGAAQSSELSLCILAQPSSWTVIFLKNNNKTNKQKISPPPAPSQFQASEPGRGELTQPVLVEAEGPAAGSASHWLPSRLCADWLRRSAAALGESPLALRSRTESGGPASADYLG